MKQWIYLEQRADSWREQLYIKGKRIKASVIYSDMILNEMTPQEASINWDLPLAAIQEVTEYCTSNQGLLAREAEKGLEMLNVLE